jgi:hypothetical protein
MNCDILEQQSWMKVEVRRAASVAAAALYTLREIEGEEVSAEQMRLLANALAQLGEARGLVDATLKSIGEDITRFNYAEKSSR